MTERELDALVAEKVMGVAPPPCHPVEAIAGDRLVCRACGLVSVDGGTTWYDDGGEG